MLMAVIRTLLILSLGIILAGCGFIKGSTNEDIDRMLKNSRISYIDDNPVEECLEDQLKDWTSLEIDLTPASEEKSD